MIDEKMLNQEEQIRAYAEIYARNLIMYGVDVREKLETATQMSYSLNQAYLRGRQDESDRGWIPCSERLPECEWGYETKELMYQLKDTDSIEIGYYGCGGKLRDRYFRTYRDCFEGVHAKDVVAWQPLPQPYKGE